jgi:hypothetical protein
MSRTKGEKMNPELQARWVAALRSGSYKQGRGSLWRSDSNTYCCLGVLCDISGMGEWVSPNSGAMMGYQFGNELSQFSLVHPILDAVDLNFVEVNELISLNDAGGLSFNEIADHIEDNL